MKKNISLLLGSLAVVIAIILVFLIPMLYLPDKADKDSVTNPTAAVTLGDTTKTTTTTNTTTRTITPTTTTTIYSASSWQDCFAYVNQERDECLKQVAIKNHDEEICKRIIHAGMRAECFERA